jgi:hypothetical protein
VYNRISWLNALSKVMKTPLEHEDAPQLRRYSIPEFRARLAPFASSRSFLNAFREEPAAQGLEGRRVQRSVRRTFNALAAGVGAPLRLASHRLCRK